MLARSLAVPTAVLVACLAAPAQADVVYVRGGKVYEDVETRWDGQRLVVSFRKGELSIPKAQVLKVEERETSAQRVTRELAALAPDEHDGALELAAFALEKELLEPARVLALSVVKARPDDPLAKAMLEGPLDYHLVDGEWQAPEVYYPARGYVKVGEEWLSPATAQLRQAELQVKNTERQLADMPKQLRREQRSVDKAEEALIEAQDELKTAQDRVAHYTEESERIGGLLTAATQAVRVTGEELARQEERVQGAFLLHSRWVARPCVTCPANQGCAPNCAWNVEQLRLLSILSQIRLERDRARHDHRVARDELRRQENNSKAVRRRLERAGKTLLRAQQEVDEEREDLSEARAELAQARAEQETLRRTLAKREEAVIQATLALDEEKAKTARDKLKD